MEGWFIVTYGLGIFLLNNLIGFLSPQVRARNGVMVPHPFLSRFVFRASSLFILLVGGRRGEGESRVSVPVTLFPRC